MKKRDKAILDDLLRFRVMSRDDIAHLHFSHTKNPEKEANAVLLRLRDRGYVDINTERRPYLYFSTENKMKRNSSKIEHFLSILRFYQEISEHGDVSIFEVEPKLMEKGGPEPDAFFRFKRGVFFLELQRSVYSQHVMKEKMKRYQTYYDAGTWKQLPWQSENRLIFPVIWIITERTYPLPTYPFHVFQTQTAIELIKQFPS